MTSDELRSLYADNVERVRHTLQESLSPSPGGSVLAPYFLRGKMFRARLVCAAAEAVGGNPDDVEPGAVAIELLHGASLLHDDIIDRSPQRRGFVSVHERLGVEQALVLGDDLLLMAYAAIGAARPGQPASRILDTIETLTACARDCCRGQFDELRASRWISEDEYLSIVRGKTAAQFVAASTVGATLAGASQRQLQGIRNYAEQVGVAFQIGDDLRDIVGDSRAMGKPTGNSLELGRPLLPLIYLWDADPESAQAAVTRLADSNWSIDELVRQLELHDIPERVRRIQHRYAATAIEVLDEFEASAGVNALRALAMLATSDFAPQQSRSCNTVAGIADEVRP